MHPLLLLLFFNVAVFVPGFQGQVISTQGTLEPNDCGVGYRSWSRYKESCYSFLATPILDWHNAEEYCFNNGAHLVSVHSEEENEYIYGKISVMKGGVWPDFVASFWTGLNAIGDDASFEWSDGSLVTYTSLTSITPGLEKCVFFNKLSRDWNITGCATKLGVICKRSFNDPVMTLTPPSTTTAPGNCPAGWQRSGNKCFGVFGTASRDRLNWTTALSKCKAMGRNHDLASFHSDYEQASLTKALTKNSPKLWIGLVMQEKDRQIVHWSDNSRVDYTNWAPGMPYGSRFWCVDMQTADNHAGKWGTENCNLENGYVCQRPPDVSFVTSAPNVGCPKDGFVKYGKNCYKVIPEAETWDVAESTCTKSDSHLLSVLSNYEQAFLRTYLDPTSSISAFWLGLSHHQDNRYFWTDGWPIYFTNWGPNEPGPYQSTYCVYMNPKTMEWGVQLCTQKTAYICKFSMEKPPVVPEVKYEGCPSNESHWIDVGLHHCYTIDIAGMTSPVMSVASLICSQHGSELASFHSEHQINLIQPFLKDSEDAFWTGLLRKHHGGFEWIDKSPVNYKRWADGQPSNITTNNCVSMSQFDMKWSTTSCDIRLRYICMIPKEIITTPTSQLSTKSVAATTPLPDCGPGFRDWKLYNGYCYFFETPQYLDWHNAESFCFNKSGHLLSISSDEENEFIFQQVTNNYRLPATFWIGMNAIGSDAAFEWSDGTPLKFISVNADIQGRERCVYFNKKSKDWTMSHCSYKTGALCKRRFGDEPITITKPVTTVSPGNCPEGWLRAGNKCFGLFGTQPEDRLTWTTAWQKCRDMGLNSDLASLHSSYEHALLIQNFSDTTPPIWIGLNRLGVYNAPYGWSDNTKLDFTNWASGMPSNAQLKCGEMITTGANVGRWISKNCEVKNAYICQQSPDQSVVTKAPDVSGCPAEGYLKSGRNCYKVYQTTATWTKAEAECRQSGSHLVSVMSNYEQALIHTLVQSAKNTEGFWLGLSHGQDERFKWTDGWPVYFTNWAKDQPGLYNSSLCVYLDPEFMEWAVGDCKIEKQFICKFSNEDPPTLPDLNTEVCPSHVKDWIDVGLDHCYFIQRKVDVYGSRNTKSFAEVTLGCSQNASKAASFHSQHELDLLNPYFEDSVTSIWTGLLRKHHGGFEWIDNSPVDFENWGEGQPANKAGSLCVEMNSVSTKWATQACTVINGYICKIEKVFKKTTVISTTNKERITVSTIPPVPGCGPGFRDWELYNGFCYLFKTPQLMDWYTAEEYCFEQSAHLASIHSEDENQFILEQGKKFSLYMNAVWIGMNAIGSDAAFWWSDGTTVDYSSLTTPDNGKERCVSFVSKYGDWAANPCSDKKGAVCKRRYGDEPITITKPPTTMSPLNCPERWLRVGNKCYALFGTAIEERQNWTSARENCKKMGPSHDLASFHSSYEHAVVFKNFTEATPIPWIGLNRIGNHYVRYGWSDNTRLVFTNWAPGMPNSVQLKCAEIVTNGSLAGKWVNKNCEAKNAYICQQIPDDSSVTDAPDHTGCPDEGYLKHQGKCYKLSATSATWKEAEADCKKSGSNLASIISTYEQALVLTLIQPSGINDGVWLGLSHGQDDRFKWTDGWPVYYTNWAKDQPGKYNSSLCVYINQEFMEWSVGDCSEKRHYICKLSKEVLPTVPPPNTNFCPSHTQNWTDIGLDHCYFILKSGNKYDGSIKNFGDASLNCSQSGSQIASFHSQHEMDMLLPNFQDSSFSLWTGLVKKFHGGFEWSDSSPVDFTNWDESEPADNNGYLCVEMNKISGKWKTQICSSKIGYICKVSKAPMTISTMSTTRKDEVTSKRVPVTTSRTSLTSKAVITTKRDPPKTSAKPSGSTDRSTTINTGLGYHSNSEDGLSGGSIAGIVIAVVVVVLILALAGYIYFRKKPGKPITDLFNLNPVFNSKDKTDDGVLPLLKT